MNLKDNRLYKYRGEKRVAEEVPDLIDAIQTCTGMIAIWKLDLRPIGVCL